MGKNVKNCLIHASFSTQLYMNNTPTRRFAQIRNDFLSKFEKVFSHFPPVKIVSVKTKMEEF